MDLQEIKDSNLHCRKKFFDEITIDSVEFSNGIDYLVFYDCEFNSIYINLSKIGRIQFIECSFENSFIIHTTSIYDELKIQNCNFSNVCEFMSLYSIGKVRVQENKFSKLFNVYDSIFFDQLLISGNRFNSGSNIFSWKSEAIRNEFKSSITLFDNIGLLQEKQISTEF